MNRTIGSLFTALSTAALFAGCAADPDATSDDIGTPDGPLVAIPATAPLSAAHARPSSNAASLVAGRPDALNMSAKDAFVQGNVLSSGDVYYVPHERTYAGLPVVGGDFVMVFDGAGQNIYTSTALQRPIDIASTKPTLSQAAA